MARTNDLARRRFELMAAEYLARMGERIRKRREELDLTQEDVARQMPGKVTGQRIHLWEKGRNRPRDDSLEALAGVLDVPVSYFLAAEADKTDTPDLVETMSGDGRSSDELPSRLARLEEIALQNQRMLIALATERGLIPQTAAVELRRDLEPLLRQIEEAAGQGQPAKRRAPVARRRATG